MAEGRWPMADGRWLRTEENGEPVDLNPNREPGMERQDPRLRASGSFFWQLPRVSAGRRRKYPGGMNVAARVHEAVLTAEILDWLAPRPGQIFVDGTLGAGGHTRALAERVGESGRVIALDRDADALAAAEKNLAGLPVAIAQANFCDLAEVLAEIDLRRVDGIVLDLGLSSDQLADAERGFSFDSPGLLDLRFDVTAGEPACAWSSIWMPTSWPTFCFATARNVSAVGLPGGLSKRERPSRCGPPSNWPPWCGGRSAARPNRGSMRRRARFRLCGSRSMPNWNRCDWLWRGCPTCWRPTADWRSSASIRWKTGW